MQRMIGVVGAGSCEPELERLAERVGELIAQRGFAVVCGGLGGVMEAACRGARKACGLTVGILPGGEVSGANPFVDVPVVTGLGEARNVIIVRSSCAVIAIGGEHGTLSEIAFALKLGVPVIGLRTWQLRRADQPEEAGILRAASAEEAVTLACEQVS